MSRFEPVFLPEGRELRARASQTFLRHYNGCPRSAFLYALFKGEASTVEMQRGKALHRTVELAIRTMVEQDEPMIPAEVVKDIVNSVLEDPEYAVAIEEHDYIREMAFRWARDFAIDPRAVVACETLFVLDLGGWQVRCKIDLAQLLEKGAVCKVDDWKSSRAMPGYEEISRKRTDGTLAAKAFQLILYALCIAYGVPVREEPCGACGGRGVRMAHKDLPERVMSFGELEAFYLEHQAEVRFIDCAECRGRGVVEIPEPFGVADHVQRFDLALVFPGIEGVDGLMASRPLSLTRLELVEYRASLEALLLRLAHSEEAGDWPAIVSDSACSECPAKSLCPIPVELRDHRGTINTVEEASEAAEVLYREKKEHAARMAELRAFAKATGEAIPFGANKVLELVSGEVEELRDRDAMFEAVERAAMYGEPFDRAQFVKPKTRTSFKERTVGVEEIEEATA